jgi:predicted RND superfamily exporter protein
MAQVAGYNARLERISSAIADALIGYRAWVLVLTVAITAFFGYEALHQRLDPGFDKSIPLSHPYMETYKKYKPEFGGSNMITIFVEDKSGNMFNPKFFTILEHVTQDILTMDGIDVRTVTSLFTPNVNYVAVTEEGFTGSRIVPADFVANDEGLAKVRENLARSNEIGRTVAKDLSGALVIAELVEVDPVTGQKVDYRAMAQKLEQLRAKYDAEGGVNVRIIGFATFIGDMIDGARDVIGFFAVTLAITYILLIFFARSWKLATAAILVSIAAVIWQLGAIKLVGYGVDPLSIMVPFLVLSIGVSHAVQMTNAWRLGVAEGLDSKAAARQAFNRLFIPGATALVANAAGFAVITVIDIAIIRELGITASIGVAVMLITNKFMLPVMLSYLKLSPAELEHAKPRNPQESSRWLGWMSAGARKPVSVVILLIGAGLFALGVVERRALIIGDAEAGAPELRADSRYNEDIRAIVSKFTVGLDELVVIAQASKANGCVDYPVMETIDDFVWYMRNVPGVRSVKSLSQVVRERNVGNFEANPKFLGLPRNEEMISANIYRVEMSERLFNNDCSAMPVTIYPVDHRAETLRPIIKAAKEFQASNKNPDVSFHLAMGNAGIMAATNEAVEASQLGMAVILYIAVGLCCLLTFFSWRPALAVLIPLALVTVFADAVMVWLNIGLKVSTLPVLALGVGVGVDYGIYLFARTQVYLAAGLKFAEAYARALREVGGAVMFTATTMSLGVATWYFSSLKFQADMGVLLAYMFFVNMLGAIFLMPAIAVWLVGDRRPVGRVMAH